MTTTTLAFEPLQSMVDPEFWSELSTRKLTEYRLDKSERNIFAIYTTGETSASHVNSSRISINGESFLKPAKSATDDNKEDNRALAFVGNRYSNIAPGVLLNVNTADEFKDLDKKKFLREQCLSMLKRVCSGDWVTNPSVLATFCLLSFADLKSYTFYYWFAFPTIVPLKAIEQVGTVRSLSSLCSSGMNQQEEEQQRFNNTEMDSLTKSYLLYQIESSLNNKGFFIVSQSADDVNNHFLIHPLSEYAAVRSSNREILFGFNDPGCLAENANVLLKNYIVAIALTFKLSTFKVVCFRVSKGGDKVDISKSIVIEVRVNLDQLINKQAIEYLSQESQSQDSADVQDVLDSIKIVGWEKNLKGALAPRHINLSSMMDPMRLAANSVSLNLELMKWRMFPDLDLRLLSQTKCLLIGSGTLGCHVARNLMAWGIFNITMVDRTKVSFSNPVRQPLYEFEDCLNGGRDKAKCAAEKLKKIFPLANVRGESLDIPMPGHVVPDSEIENVRKNYEKMERLILEHDVIYLLTDTRESRWLPSVMGAQHRKIVINAALGYESYVVMRHGVVCDDDSTPYRLGCYFCNDVVAPVDSTRDRTLDMQCTVTRPGVSAMAGALAVELLVSMVHHPRHKYAPASILSSENDVANRKSNHVDVGGSTASDFGWVPHQIRGSLTNFQTYLMVGAAYNQCTACSHIILDKYATEGFSFMLQAFNNPGLLEELTGLKELHEKTQKLFDDFEALDDDDEDFELL